MSETTVLLADALPVVLLGLRRVLEIDPGFHIVAETCDGLEAVHLTEVNRPSVLVAEQCMPGLTGFFIARNVRSRVPETKIVLLMLSCPEPTLLEALSCGAVGVVSKTSCTQELLHAVREVVAGRYYVSPTLLQKPLEHYIEVARLGAPSALDSLTVREREVMQLTSEGKTSVEIAARLCISTRTAETHRGNLMRKLGLHNHTDLIRYAIRQGILPHDG
jgi:DNA-binding NarL/FixJ family response regulator